MWWHVDQADTSQDIIEPNKLEVASIVANLPITGVEGHYPYFLTIVVIASVIGVVPRRDGASTRPS
jgi:hypothetical protein